MKKHLIIIYLSILFPIFSYAQHHELAFGTRFMKTQDFSDDYIEPTLASKFLKTVYSNQNKTDYYLRFNAQNRVSKTSTGYNSPSLGLSYKYSFKVNRLKIKIGITGLLYNQTLENNITTNLDYLNLKDTISYLNAPVFENSQAQTTNNQEIYKRFSRFSVPFELRYDIKKWELGAGFEYYRAYIYQESKYWTGSRPTEYNTRYFDSSGIVGTLSVIRWFKSLGFEVGINKQIAKTKFEGINEFDTSENQLSPIKYYCNLIYRF